MSGYSTSLFSVPKVGASLFLKYIINNLNLLENNYADFIKSNKFLWIDLNENIINTKELIVDELNYQHTDEGQLKAGCSWKEIEGSIRSLMGDSEPGVILVIDNASLLTSQFTAFAHRLMTLNRSFFSQVLFLFISIEEIPDNEVTAHALGQMYPLMMHNIKYFRLFNKEEMQLVKQNIWKELPNEVGDLALKISAGLPGLFRILHREFIKNKTLPKTYDEMMNSLEIRHLFMSLWSALDDSTQDLLLRDENYTNEYLDKTGLKTQESGWFSPHFEGFVALIRQKGTSINLKSTSIEKLLTYQELALYKVLAENRGKIVTREQIAQTIWEDQWVDKYSDWAIAKLVSQLRKKTSAFEDITIKTVQNQGFMRV